MRYSELFEFKFINLSKKAFNSLSSDARSAINSWESHNWTGGALEKHIKANDAVAQEIIAAIQPAIAAIGKDKITLYRGIQLDGAFDDEYVNSKFLESWSSSRKVAEGFAGLRTLSGRSVLQPTYTDEEIDAFVAKLETTGFVKVGPYKYKVPSKKIDWPEGFELKGTYYEIYDRNNSYLTDGDDLRDSLVDDNNWKKEQNEKRLVKAKVFEEDISVGRIVWITNNLGSQEFIIRKA